MQAVAAQAEWPEGAARAQGLLTDAANADEGQQQQGSGDVYMED